MRNYTYTAADFDHDKDAVDHLKLMNKNGLISYLDAHELQQSYDSSKPCSIKKSLKSRMDESYKFVLVVGEHTNAVTKGGCQLCESYNIHTGSCARGYSVDRRSYIRFECEKAVEEGLQVVVLYKSTKIDRDLCPMPVRNQGVHQQMIYRDYDGHYYWDDGAIQRAMRG